MHYTLKTKKKNWQSKKKKIGKKLANKKTLPKKKNWQIPKKKKIGKKLATINLAKKKLGKTEKKNWQKIG